MSALLAPERPSLIPPPDRIRQELRRVQAEANALRKLLRLAMTREEESRADEEDAHAR